MHGAAGSEGDDDAEDVELGARVWDRADPAEWELDADDDVVVTL